MSKSHVVAEVSEQGILRTRIHWGIMLIPFFIIVPLALLSVIPMLFFRYLLAGVMPSVPAILTWGPIVMLLIPFTALFLWTFVAFLDTEYSLTTRRLHFRTGWLLRATGELLLEDIEAILLVEPIVGRLLDYGTVVVIGGGGTQFPLRFIPAVNQFHRKLMEAREAVRSGQRPQPDSCVAVPTPKSAESGYPSTARPIPPRQGPSSQEISSEGDLMRAWQALNNPPQTKSNDDSRYMPKS